MALTKATNYYRVIIVLINLLLNIEVSVAPFVSLVEIIQ